MHVREEINEAYEYIRKRTHYTPAIGIILGTGYHQLADMIEQPEQTAMRISPISRCLVSQDMKEP